jgi:hypothetical protein
VLPYRKTQVVSVSTEDLVRWRASPVQRMVGMVDDNVVQGRNQQVRTDWS